MPTYRPSHRSHAATPRPAHPRQHGRAGSFRSPERLASGNRAGTVGSLSLGAWLSPWGRWRSSVVPPWPRGLHVLFHGRLPPPSLVECPFFGRSFGCRAADVGRKLPLRLAGVGVTAPCCSKI